MIRTIKGSIAARSFEFRMDLDPGFAQDAGLAAFLDSAAAPEPEVCHLMARALREGDVAIDGGAAVGFFTLLMRQFGGPAGRVIAVEPDSRNLNRLEANAALNERDNIEIVPKALWSQEGQMEFRLYDDSGYNCIARNSEGANACVNVTTLGKLGVTRVRLLKLDVEGAEVAAMTAPASADFVVAECNEPALQRFGESPETLRRRMSELGYNCFALHGDGSLPTYIPPRISAKPLRQNTNLLYTTFDHLAEAWPQIQL